MKLSEHIAKLLLAHDCVIIPNFGGFVAYHEPAKLKHNVLLPAKREIGFNAKLTHNDGLLAQAYMQERNCTFEFAERQINSELNELLHLLKANSRAVFGEIGILTLNETNVLSFEPNKDFDAAPQYYGLDDFCFYPKYVVREAPFARFMKYAAVVAVALLTLTPSNFDTQQNAASMLPIDWKRHLPDISQPTEDTLYNVAPADISETEAVLPEVVEITENYHVIIASFVTERQAKRFLKEVESYDFSDIHIVKCEGRCRIAVQSFAENDDAEVFRTGFIGKYPDFGEAWVFEEKN